MRGYGIQTYLLDLMEYESRGIFPGLNSSGWGFDNTEKFTTVFFQEILANFGGRQRLKRLGELLQATWYIN